MVIHTENYIHTTFNYTLRTTFIKSRCIPLGHEQCRFCNYASQRKKRPNPSFQNPGHSLPAGGQIRHAECSFIIVQQTVLMLSPKTCADRSRLNLKCSQQQSACILPCDSVCSAKCFEQQYATLLSLVFTMLHMHSAIVVC